MSEPHERLDQAMKDRLLEIKKRWTQIASEAGVTVSALGAIRRGEYRPSPLTAQELEDAFEWEHGSIAATYAGGDPTPIDDGTPPDLHAVPDADDERLDRLEESADNLAAMVQEVRDELAELRRNRERDAGSHDRHGVR